MTDKVQKIREEVARIQLYTQSEVLKQVLDYIDEVQKEPVSIWHDANEKPNIKEKSGIFVITSLNGEYIGSRYYNHNDITINFGNYDKWAYLNDLLNLSNVQRTVKDRKEPVSEDLEEAADSYIKTHGEILGFGRQTFKAGAKWQKAKDKSVTNDLGDYINELSKQFPEVSFAKLSRIAVRVAKWQQERDEADRAAVYKCGWNDRKAMMMKKSFDAKILPTNIEETEFCLDDYEEVAIITEMVNKGEFKMGDKVKVNVIKED